MNCCNGSLLPQGTSCHDSHDIDYAGKTVSCLQWGRNSTTCAILMFIHYRNCKCTCIFFHYNDVILTTISPQITGLMVVYSILYSDADQRNIKAPRHWPLCGEFTGSGEFLAQRSSYAENVSIWWRHHGKQIQSEEGYWMLLLWQHLTRYLTHCSPV